MGHNAYQVLAPGIAAFHEKKKHFLGQFQLKKPRAAVAWTPLVNVFSRHAPNENKNKISGVHLKYKHDWSRDAERAPANVTSGGQ